MAQQAFRIPITVPFVAGQKPRIDVIRQIAAFFVLAPADRFFEACQSGYRDEGLMQKMKAWFVVIFYMIVQQMVSFLMLQVNP